MIILLNGSINSGKSTVAKALSTKCKRCAHVEVDVLREFIDWMPLNDAIPINLANAAAVTKNFIINGLRTVISYPLSCVDYNYLTNEFSSLKVPIIAVTLNPGLEECVKNRGTRRLSQQEVERIHYMYQSGLASPGFGVEVNNATLTVDETVLKIMEIARWRAEY